MLAAKPTRRGVRLSVFNHKGGVGKTTLTMNLGATLAKAGSRVLLVDSDPQCNLTSYLIEEEVVDRLLDEADRPEGRTIWSGVQPVAEAIGGVKPLLPLETSIANLFLLPGDIRLSEFETDLSDFWAQCFQRKPKGFRGTTAISELVGQVVEEHQIEYVLFDSGPNIGPLNRVLLLDCDYFIVPLACDLFSLRALKTLGRTLTAWIADWRTVADLAPEGIYLLPGQPRFLGYVPGRFRVYRGQVVAQQSTYLSQIEREVHSQLVLPLRAVDSHLAPGSLKSFKLGELQDFGSLVPASQLQGAPISEVDAGSAGQRARAAMALATLTKRMTTRIQGWV